MRKTAKFLAALFLALGQMISFSPRERGKADSLQELEPFNPRLEQNFEAVWGYLAKVVK